MSEMSVIMQAKYQPTQAQNFRSGHIECPKRNAFHSVVWKSCINPMKMFLWQSKLGCSTTERSLRTEKKRISRGSERFLTYSRMVESSSSSFMTWVTLALEIPLILAISARFRSGLAESMACHSRAFLRGWTGAFGMALSTADSATRASGKATGWTMCGFAPQRANGMAR